jgi:hypothetical protein
MLAVLHPFHRDVPSPRAPADPSAGCEKPPTQAIAARSGSLDAPAELGQRLDGRGWGMAAALESDGEPIGWRLARGTDQLCEVAR